MAAFTGTSEIHAKLISICRSHRKTKEALPQMLCGFFFFLLRKEGFCCKECKRAAHLHASVTLGGGSSSSAHSSPAMVTAFPVACRS